MLESISNTFTPHRNRPSSKSSAHFQKENRESDPNFLFLVSFEKTCCQKKTQKRAISISHVTEIFRENSNVAFVVRFNSTHLFQKSAPTFDSATLGKTMKNGIKQKSFFLLKSVPTLDSTTLCKCGRGIISTISK